MTTDLGNKTNNNGRHSLPADTLEISGQTAHTSHTDQQLTFLFVKKTQYKHVWTAFRVGDTHAKCQSASQRGVAMIHISRIENITIYIYICIHTLLNDCA